MTTQTEFKRAQVLRTNVTLTAQTGETVPAGTRIVMLQEVDAGEWKAKVQDPNLEKLRDKRVFVTADKIAQTHRGRPRKVKAD